MLWAMLGTVLAIWAVFAVLFGLGLVLRRRRARTTALAAAGRRHHPARPPPTISRRTGSPF
jgi:hypothetical protein